MKFPYRIGLYEKAIAKEALPKLMIKAANAGFDTFEISLDETDERLARLDWSGNRIREIANIANQEGIQLFSACLSGHRKYALGSADTNIVNQAMEIMEKAILFCCETGIRVLQITVQMCSTNLTRLTQRKDIAKISLRE